MTHRPRYLLVCFCFFCSLSSVFITEPREDALSHHQGEPPIKERHPGGSAVLCFWCGFCCVPGSLTSHLKDTIAIELCWCVLGLATGVCLVVLCFVVEIAYIVVLSLKYTVNTELTWLLRHSSFI